MVEDSEMMHDERKSWMHADRGDKSANDMPISEQESIELAQSYLDLRIQGTFAEDHAAQFYGYYTIHVLENDFIVGMLSVNGFTGEVWFHDWHGEFTELTDLNVRALNTFFSYRPVAGIHPSFDYAGAGIHF